MKPTPPVLNLVKIPTDPTDSTDSTDGDRKGTRAVVEFQLSRLIGSVRRHVWVYPGRAGSALTIDEQNRVRAYRLDHPDAQL